MPAKKNKVSLWLFAIAAIFLFNPNMAIVDPLPDFIGYILLSFALSKISMISDSLYDAKSAFERMAIIDAGKLVSVIWVFGMCAADERSISLLLFSFVFGVLEIVFAIPAFVKLFAGFSYLGNFYPNTSIHGTAYMNGRKKKGYTDSIRAFTIFFIIFKAVFTCLPEFTALSSANSFENPKIIDMYRYIGVIRGFCIIPVIIIGLIWLGVAISYFIRISKDKELIDALDVEYSQKKILKRGAFVIKDIKIATFFMVVASIFSIDIELDGMNILPDLVVIIALAISLFYFSKTAKFNKLLAAGTFGMYAFLSVFEDIVIYSFENTYHSYNAIEKDGEAFVFYTITVIAVAAEGVMLIFAYTMMAKALKSVIAEHTGYVVGKEIQGEGEERQILAVQKRLNKNFSLLADVAILCALAETFCSLYGAFYAFLNKNFAWINIVGIICGLLLVVMTIKAVIELKEAVQTKYMLE